MHMHIYVCAKSIYAKWNKSNGKEKNPYDFTQVEYKTKSNKWSIKMKKTNTKNRMVVTRAEGIGEGKMGKVGKYLGAGGN